MSARLTQAISALGLILLLSAAVACASPEADAPPTHTPTTSTEPTVPQDARTATREPSTSAPEPRASYTRLDAIPEGGKAQAGQWYYHEEETESHHNRVVFTTIPDTSLYTMYGCTTTSGRTVPWAKVRYPESLPASLITGESALPIETAVNGHTLKVEWMTAMTRDTEIRAEGASAQRLAQALTEPGADSYHLAVAGAPETGHVVDASGLGDALVDAGMDCLLSEVEEMGPPVLNPPATPQSPRNGLFTYTSPGGHYTFQYPEDCGQLWESPTEADNVANCPGARGEIGVYVEVSAMGRPAMARPYNSPEEFARGLADNLAERFSPSIRLSAETNKGLHVEVVESRSSHAPGAEVWVTAVHVGPDWSFILISMVYIDGEDTESHSRAVAALRTLEAGSP